MNHEAITNKTTQKDNEENHTNLRLGYLLCSNHVSYNRDNEDNDKHLMLQLRL